MGIFGSKKESVDIDGKVIKLIEDLLGSPGLKISEQSVLSEIGIDSIKFVNILIGVEGIIGKDLEEVIEGVDFSNIHTIGDLIALVKRMA